jgi:hypothetical protein
MEKCSGKDYLKQGMILSDMIRNPTFFFLRVAVTSQIQLKSDASLADSRGQQIRVNSVKVVSGWKSM